LMLLPLRFSLSQAFSMLTVIKPTADCHFLKSPSAAVLERRRRKKNRNRIHLSNVTVFRKLRYFSEKGFFKTKTRVESGKSMFALEVVSHYALPLGLPLLLALSSESERKTSSLILVPCALICWMPVVLAISTETHGVIRPVGTYMSALVYFH